MLDPDYAKYIATQIILELINEEIAQPRLTKPGESIADIRDEDDMVQVHETMHRMKNMIED